MQLASIKERPIIFSTEMVRALLDGRKVQTRRLMSRDDESDIRKTFPYSIENCRFGKVGDTLWVREKIYCFDGNTLPKQEPPDFDGNLTRYGCNFASVACHDTDPSKIISPIYMPRWCCRIELVVTEVSLERLNDISEADAIAEGIDRVSAPLEHDRQCYKNYIYPTSGLNPVESYATLWNTIAKFGSRWADNPWVWVLKFEVQSN